MLLFEKVLSTLPHQKLGLFLYENQGWERIFIHLWKKNGHGKIIGIQHATIPFWYLPYFDEIAIEMFENIPIVDLIAVNGPNSWDILKKSGYPMHKCFPVEALRYSHLIKKSKIDNRSINQKICNNILILGDIQTSTTNNMLQLIDKSKNDLKKYNIYVKLHPANQMDLNKYSFKFEVTEKSFEDLFLNKFIVFSSATTSASLDAYCSNMPVIIYLDSFDFNLSPLDKNDFFVYFINNRDEFLKILSEKKWGNQKNMLYHKDYFWLDKTFPKWEKFLKEELV